MYLSSMEDAFITTVCNAIRANPENIIVLFVKILCKEGMRPETQDK